MKKRKKNFEISNKLAYTLIAILSIILIGVGVYAWNYPGPPSTMGHSAGELAPPASCASGQTLTYNGATWICAKPSGTDTRFTINSNGICYTAPDTCKYESLYCGSFGYVLVELAEGQCDFLSQSTLNSLCGGECNEQYGFACDGRNSFCGGSVVNYQGNGFCEGGSTVYCQCEGSGIYTQATFIPSGTRCV